MAMCFGHEWSSATDSRRLGPGRWSSNKSPFDKSRDNTVRGLVVPSAECRILCTPYSIFEITVSGNVGGLACWLPGRSSEYTSASLFFGLPSTVSRKDVLVLPLSKLRAAPLSRLLGEIFPLYSSGTFACIGYKERKRGMSTFGHRSACHLMGRTILLARIQMPNMWGINTRRI